MHRLLVPANPWAHLLDAALQDLEPPAQREAQLLVHCAATLSLLRRNGPDHCSTQPLEGVLCSPLQSACQLTGFTPWQAAPSQDVLNPFGPFLNLVVGRLQGDSHLRDLGLDAQDNERVSFATLFRLDRVLPQASPDQPSRRRS